MIVGAVIVLAPNFHGIQAGDFIILLATFFPPIGNMFQQKAKNIASTESILFLRSILSVPIIFAIAFIMGSHVAFHQVILSLPYLLISGVILVRVHTSENGCVFDAP